MDVEGGDGCLQDVGTEDQSRNEVEMVGRRMWTG